MSTRTLPLRGAANPSSLRDGTNPGSFANAPNLGGALSFSSPDTPGMPAPSDKTAWDFLPPSWDVEDATGRPGDQAGRFVFTDSTGVTRAVRPPAGFVPITQLEHARLGVITPQVRRVA